jgi:hypothetical protein
MICNEVNAKYNASYHNSDKNKNNLLGRALPDFDDGEKALDLLAPPGEPNTIFANLLYYAYFASL